MFICSLFNHQIKADVETQGEFVNSLIQEVNNAVYQNIEDVVAFVKWLDDELCFLVSLSLALLLEPFSTRDLKYNYLDLLKILTMFKLFSYKLRNLNIS